MDIAGFFTGWNSVIRVETAVVEPGRVVCTARSENGEPVTLAFQAAGPAVLRISAACGSGIEALKPLNAISAPASNIPADIGAETVEFDDRLELALKDAKVVIMKEPFRWFVLDASGKFLAGEGIDDVTVALWPRMKPLGLLKEWVSVEGRPVGEPVWRGALRLKPGEGVYGLGELFTPLNRRGQHVDSWNVDAYGTSNDRAYKNVPFFWTTSGYGVLFNTYRRVVHDVGNPAFSLGSYLYTVESPLLDLVLFFGQPAGILDAYTQLTGRPALPPYWAFGVWMSRCYYESQAEAEEVAQRLRDAKLPCDVLTMDGRAWLDVRTRCDFRWDRSRVPDPQGLIDRLHKQGFKVCVWEYPYLSVHNPDYPELAIRGYFMKDSDGNPYVFQWAPAGFNQFLTLLPPSSIVDFTNPDAVQWFRELHNDLLKTGVDVFKTDFGEQVPEDCLARDGRTGRELHNEYAVLYNRTVYETTREHGSSGALVFGRSGWAGSQCYPVQWGGDTQSSWEGMAFSLRGGLGYCSSGVPLWTSDVGGFYGPKPDPGLYMRWVEFGALCPFMRLHGTTPREPWEYGEEAVRIYREYTALRYQLLPYLYAASEKASRTGLPVMRPLALDFPEDPLARQIEDEFLLGPSLLVCPVLTPDDRRNVYLPGGRWVDFWTGVIHEGPTAFEADLPLDRIGVFARYGHAIALGPVLQQIKGDWPVVSGLRVFGEGDGQVSVPGPEGPRTLVYRAIQGHLSFEGRLAREVHEVTAVGLGKAILSFATEKGSIRTDLVW